MPTVSVAQALELALQHHQSGRLSEAEPIYRQILAAEPNHPDALHLLGLLSQATDRHDAAVEFLSKASRVKPNDAELFAAMGASLGICGRIDDAIVALTRALQLQPEMADATANIFNAYLTRGKTSLHAEQFQAAIADLSKAVELSPQNAEAHYNLGVALERTREQDAAREHYRRATQLDPSFAEAHFNLGACSLSGLHLDAALNSFREAARLKPDLVMASDMLLHFQHHKPEVDPSDLFEQHVQWAKRYAEPLAKEIQRHKNVRDPDRRLRIGYVSPNLRRHSVSYFFEPLLAAHDPRQFEIFCYADGLKVDATTERLQKLAHKWRNITSCTDAEVAEIVRGDEIDILIDLAGHTQHNRLLVFARKPAPVQVTFLGYPDTTGMSAIDYRLTDAFADPPGITESLHTEELIRLPDCAWCYRPDDDAPPVVEHVTSDGVTFGSFNDISKINAPLIALWAEILRAAPDSRMLLKAGHATDSLAQTEIRIEFAKHGVQANRLEFAGYLPKVEDHLRLLSRIDIALDSFPYNGTTTTCETLWMGVPMVTLAGKTHVSRVGASLLHCMGLVELIATTAEEYVEIAVRLAHDRARIAQLRSEMRQRIKASPLMDLVACARKVESAYREMWQEWCRE